MNRADWLLLIIAAAKGQPLTPVQMQKIPFLVSKDLYTHLPQDFYAFEPHDYGPFSNDISKDVTRLIEKGVVAFSINPVGYWKEYRVTEIGLATAQQLKTNIPNEAISYIENVTAWARALSFQEFVRAIYQKYPEYRKHGVFQGI